MASEFIESETCKLSLAGSTIFVGSACWDVIVDVSAFPAEDCEARASSLEGACGGNAGNSAAIAAQLVEQAGTARLIRLASVIGDPASDSNSGAFLRLMKEAGVDTAGCLSLPHPATLPQSFIVRADATASRTIFHYRSIREFGSAEEILEATGITITSPGAAEKGDSRAAATTSREARAPTIAHFEGRALDATHAAMTLLPPLLPLGSIISVEVEKTRTSATALTVLDLLPLADIAFVSREFVCAALTGGVVVSEASPCPPAALATVLRCCSPARGSVLDGPDTPRGGRCRIVVVPWGAGGVNICVSSSAFTGWQRWHIPCRSPETGVVDTVGAGDVFIAAFLHAAASLVCQGITTLVELLANPAGAFTDSAGCEALRRTALACAAFACSVAGDKCGVRGLRLPAATLRRALHWAATVTPTSM
jgi:ketohexokinase